MWTLLEGRTGVALPRARVGAGRAKSMGGRASLLASFLPSTLAGPLLCSAVLHGSVHLRQHDYYEFDYYITLLYLEMTCTYSFSLLFL